MRVLTAGSRESFSVVHAAYGGADAVLHVPVAGGLIDRLDADGPDVVLVAPEVLESGADELVTALRSKRPGVALGLWAPPDDLMQTMALVTGLEGVLAPGSSPDEVARVLHAWAARRRAMVERGPASPRAVLIACGDESVVEPATGSLLSIAGFDVARTDSARQALQLLRTRDVHVLLTDPRVPELNGTSLIRAAEAYDPGIVAVIRTPAQDLRQAIGHVREAASEFIIHPEPNLDLVELVEAAWDMWAGERASKALSRTKEIARAGVAANRMRKANAELEAANRRLEALAHLDPLTEQLNRRGLQRALTAETHRAARAGGSLAAVLLDLDDFGTVNSRFGHAVGDQVLREVADRVAEVLRPTDVFGRIGGDEFLVLLPDSGAQDGLVVAERLRGAMTTSVPVGSFAVATTGSAGFAVLRRSAEGLEQVLEATREGLRRAKDGGKNRVAGSSEDAATIDALRRGEGLTAVGLPIVDLAHDRVIALELLSRAAGTPLPRPSEFFPAARAAGALVEVDLACLRTCLTEADRRDAEVVHLNLFPATVFATPAADLVELLGLPDRSVCLDLSEQHVARAPGALAKALRPLRAAGARVALDDLGFGHRSLDALLVMEPDVVKLHTRHVHGAAGDPDAERFLGRLIQAVEALDGELIAEGLERPEDRDLLLRFGVKSGQGRLFGEPA